MRQRTFAQRVEQNRPRPVICWLVVATVTLASLAACSNSQSGKPADHAAAVTPKDFSVADAQQMFITGYVDIDDVYVDQVDISHVAFDAMKGVTAIDGEASIARDDQVIHVRYKNHEVGSVAAPEHDDAQGWAVATAQLIEVERDASPKLQATGAEELYSAVWTAAIGDLDRFSRYAGYDSAQDNRARRDGFGGIGAKLDVLNQHKVASVLPDTPAEKVGIKAGDEIIVIDGTSVDKLPDSAIVPLLRGPVDSKVQLTLKRNGNATFSVTAERVLLFEPTVEYRKLAGNVGYFKVSGFNGHTAPTLSKLVRDARGELGPRMKGIVIDLRNNPGGLLSQGIAVADMFLNAGRILTTRGRHPDSLQRFDATGTDIAGGLPLVVLIDGKSASSSEIVAAALQDLGRAVLVGSSSYGKGTVQTVLPLPNDGELTLTWAKLYAPSGYALHHIGVIPNVCTSATADPAKPINDLRKGDFDPVKIIQTRRHADGMTETAQLALTQLCPQQTEHDADHDVDVEVALKLISDPALMRRSVPPLNVAAVEH